MVTSAIINNFYKEFDAAMSELNSTVSPVLLGSPFDFVNEYTVNILGNHQNFVQVSILYVAISIKLVACIHIKWM